MEVLEAKAPAVHRAKDAPIDRVNFAVPGEAQGLFFYELQERAPVVLKDLRSKWREYGLAADPFTWATLHQITDTWAAGYHLTVNGKAPVWLRAQAWLTMREWNRRPGRADIEPLTWPVARARPERSGFLSIPIAPEYLSRAQRRAEMRRAAKEIIERFLDKQAPELYASEHFAWLVRFQINGESPEDIAKHPSDRPHSVTAVQVKSALRQSARVIGIELIPFPQRKSGRHKIRKSNPPKN